MRGKITLVFFYKLKLQNWFFLINLSFKFLPKWQLKKLSFKWLVFDQLWMVQECLHCIMKKKPHREKNIVVRAWFKWFQNIFFLFSVAVCVWNWKQICMFLFFGRSASSSSPVMTLVSDSALSYFPFLFFSRCVFFFLWPRYFETINFSFLQSPSHFFFLRSSLHFHSPIVVRRMENLKSFMEEISFDWD